MVLKTTVSLPMKPINQKIVVVGQRVRWNVYCHDGIIFKIDGEQKPETIKPFAGCMTTGGNAQFHIVFKNHMSITPEAIVRGVQWDILDEVATSEEIQTARKECEDAMFRAKEEKRRRQQAFEAATEAAAKEFSWLEKQDGSKKTPWTLAASNIRKELKRAFPDQVFRVTSKSYSGGCSVDIHWTHGPTRAQVTAITGKYENSSFDGMTDCSSPRKTPHNQIFGGAKYVMEKREYENIFLKQLHRALCKEYGKEYQGQCTDIDGEFVDRKAYRLLHEIAMPAKVERFEMVSEEGDLKIKFY